MSDAKRMFRVYIDYGSETIHVEARDEAEARKEAVKVGHKNMKLADWDATVVDVRPSVLSRLVKQNV